MPFWKQNNTITTLLNSLEKLDFYKYTPASEINRIKSESRKTGDIFGGPSVQRMYHADAEDIAEGYAFAFIEEIQAFLEILGVHIHTIDQVFENDKDYTLTIDDEMFILYLDKEADTLHDLWEITTIRVFGIVNHLLISAKSTERIYMLYGGNDCHAVFLTAEMFQIIKDSKALPESEIPLPIQPYKS
jgi:hypothetical protein